jgi:hypothetical protein
MKTIRIILYIALVAGTSVSCTSSLQKKAEADFQRVDAFVRQQEFTTAMELLDSMAVWNKSDYGIVGETLRRKNAIASEYHQQAVTQKTSLLNTLQAQVQPLARDFRFTPGEAGMPGIYEHKRQTVQSSWNRTYLKITLNEKGEVWLTSHYYGKSWIDHVALRVYDSGSFVVSDTIPMDDPWNRKVEDLGDKWETIEFREGTDAGIMAFITDNYQKSLKVRFNGKSFHYIVLEGYDKEAIRNGWELAQLLKEMDGLRQSIEQHQKELKQLGTAAGA